MTILGYNTNRVVVWGWNTLVLTEPDVGDTYYAYPAFSVKGALTGLGSLPTDSNNYLVNWYMVFDIPALYKSASRLKSAIGKYTIGSYDILYNGVCTHGDFIQYTVQRTPVFVSKTRSAIVDSLTFPSYTASGSYDWITSPSNAYAPYSYYGDTIAMTFPNAEKAGLKIGWYWVAYAAEYSSSPTHFIADI